MYFIYHLSTIVFGVFLIFFYLQKLLPRNSRSSVIVWVAYVIFGIGLTALNVVPVMPIVRTIYTWFGILVLCKVCYRSAPLNAVYVATVFCALALITELLCLKLFAIMGWEYLDVMSPGYERAIYILIAKVCQLALVIIAVPNSRHRQSATITHGKYAFYRGIVDAQTGSFVFLEYDFGCVQRLVQVRVG